MIKQNLSVFFNFIGLSAFLRSQKKKNALTVLSLHRISDDNDYFWNPIKPATFEKLLQYVVTYYSVISFADIPHLKKRKSLKPYLILSFDDGYYDFYEHALPLLKKYNLPCNHNIVNDCATHNHIIWTQRLNSIFNHCKDNGINLSLNIQGNTISLESYNKNWMKFYLDMYNLLLKMPKAKRLEILKKKEQEYSLVSECKMMNWNQIIECSESLVEIGCHTYSHDVLSSISDINILSKEILDSTKEIENKIRKKVNILALPNGQGNEKIKEVIAVSEMKYILFVEDKINNLFELGNNGIDNIYRINLIEESIDEMILRIELFHTKIRKYA